MTMAEDDKNCERLMRWAAARGITDAPRSSGSNLGGVGNSLIVSNFPDAGGRGLAACRNLKEGELILRVPKSALMSVLSAKADPLLSTVLPRYPGLSSTQVLTLHLLNEAAKGQASIWFPYLVCLPRIYHTLSYFTKAEIRALQVDEARWIAERAVEKARMDWEDAKSFMGEINLRRRFRSFRAWLWASGTVSTRTLHVPWDEAGTLCPVGDLFNYAASGAYECRESSESSARFDGDRNRGVSSSSESDDEVGSSDPGFRNGSEGRENAAASQLESEFDDDSSWSGVTVRERLRDGGFEADYEEYCFYARQDYQRGQQVLLCYGLYNNLELLEHYGFLLPHNPNDNVHIGLPDAREFGLDTVNPHMQVPGAACVEISGHPSFSLLAALRLRACHPSLRRAKGHVALSGQQVSVESDILAYRWLEKQCKSLLESLATKLEDDLALQKRLIPVGSFSELEDLALLGESTREAKEVLEFFRECTSVGEGGAADEENYGVRDKDFQLERWKLALRWRIGCKEILHRCARLCSKKILHLSR